MKRSKTKGFIVKAIILLIIAATFYSTVEIKNNIENIEIQDKK